MRAPGSTEIYSQGPGTVEVSGPVPGGGLERESELIRSLSASSANMFSEMYCLAFKKKKKRIKGSYQLQSQLDLGAQIRYEVTVQSLASVFL